MYDEGYFVIFVTNQCGEVLINCRAKFQGQEPVRQVSLQTEGISSGLTQTVRARLSWSDQTGASIATSLAARPIRIDAFGMTHRSTKFK
jgi:hypothetical protein